MNNRDLLSEIRLARIAHDVKQLHTHLDDIHGIGPTIASKIVVYSLREFPFFGSSIDPRELYPAVEHLLKEYHNDLLAKELKKQYGPGIIDQVFEELKKLGDPLAIDALFYVHREEPKLKESLLYMAEVDGKTRKRESRDEDDRVLPECMGSSRNDEATTEPDGIIVEAKIIAPDGAKTARREINISKKQTAWLTSRGGPLDLSIVERKYGATRSGSGTRQVLLIPIRLRIGSRGYGAEFHYHAKWQNSWIGSPMNDGAIKLAEALADEGFLRTGPIRFRVVANEMLTLNTQ